MSRYVQWMSYIKNQATDAHLLSKATRYEHRNIITPINKHMVYTLKGINLVYQIYLFS